jgi:hypothetical protein
MERIKIVDFVCIGSLAFLSLLCWGCTPHQPSDQSLEQKFSEHRSDLEHLVAMMDEDRQMARITPEFTWRQDNLAWPRPESAWGISRKRWDDYRTIFSRAGFDGGTTRPQKSSDVIINDWSLGIVPSGITVGYLHCGQPRNGYTTTEPPCSEKRDSGAGTRGSMSRYRYKKLAEDWYIYEESN